MARAKRTDRAEARRRYRATLSEDSLPTDLDDESESEPEAEAEPSAGRASASRSRSRSTGSTSPARPARPSVIGAFRAAFHPTDLRGDVAALPRLLRHRSFYIPLALIVVAAAITAVTGGKEPISASLAPYFLAPQPVAPVFLAGFLAPRASWLIGGLLGMISWVAVVILLSTPALQQVVVSSTGTTGLSPDLLGYTFVVATISGAFYAAAAAWYKRFLALANPSRNARPTGKPGDRSRRRGSDERPLLARRR